MAALACVCDLEPRRRTTGDSGSGSGEASTSGSESKHPRAEHNWMTASIIDEILAIIAAVFDRAERRGIEIPIVIDFVHVTQYIWKAAWTFVHHR